MKRIVLQVSRDFGTLKAIEHEHIPGLWIHCEIKKWGIKEAKECKVIWNRFLNDLSSLGYKEAYSCIFDDDLKLIKWQKIFGMVEIQREKGAIVFKKELNHGS